MVGTGIGLDVNTTISTHGKGSTDGLSGSLGTDGHSNDLSGLLGLLESHSFFNGNLGRGWEEGKGKGEESVRKDKTWGFTAAR